MVIDWPAVPERFLIYATCILSGGGLGNLYGRKSCF